MRIKRKKNTEEEIGIERGRVCKHLCVRVRMFVCMCVCDLSGHDFLFRYLSIISIFIVVIFD